MRTPATVVAILSLTLGFAVVAQNAPSGTPATAPATRPTAARGAANAPPPEQLMNSMLTKPQADGGRTLQPLPDPPRTDAATGKVVAPNPPAPQLKREGTYVTDATGRIQRSADGQSWDFVFESDAQSMQDAPMSLLPNLKLMAVENILQGANRDPKFHVTGMITEYKGKNYLLLEKVTVVPDMVQQF